MKKRMTLLQIAPNRETWQGKVLRYMNNNGYAKYLLADDFPFTVRNQKKYRFIKTKGTILASVFDEARKEWKFLPKVNYLPKSLILGINSLLTY